MEGASPVGWLCLLPPLLTIVMAIVTRQVVVSLLAGIAAAILILLPTFSAYQSMAATEVSSAAYGAEMLERFLYSFCETHLWSSLVDEDHLRVFAFTTLLGMQVALIHSCGGMLGIVQWAAPLAKSRRGGQVLTWALGLVIFIDDYANTLLLGSTMRPITDRLRISREKLAFLVDSTAAPVSGLALVSTWVATEISTMQVGFVDAGIDIGTSTFSIFVQTIPTRFYILYALVFVLVCGLLCRDFGPMLRAEQKTATGPLPTDRHESVDTVPARAMNAILPIVVTVGVVVWLLVLTGREAIGDKPLPESSWQAWGEIIGQGNSYVSLVYGALAGLVVVLGLIIAQRRLSGAQIRRALLDGSLQVLPAMIILWLAWTLSGLTGKENLRTGEFLATQISQFHVAPGLMPTMTFLLASGIAFSTGTSWGTMAILMPIVIPLVYNLLSQQMAGPPAPDHYVMIACIGSVLAGAIFGDHCSPISDTTILSSRSSECDHIEHVRTQMPYAIVIGAIAIVLGTLPAGYDVSSWLLLPMGIAAIVIVLLVFGRRAEPA